MIISNQKVQNLLKLYGEKTQEAAKMRGQEKKQVENIGEMSEVDRLELSPAARLVQVARQTLKETPDIREKKVAQLVETIKKGTYEVTAEKTAAKMIDQWLMNRLR